MQQGKRIDLPKPLEGIRVLDASRILTGPFCSMLLGDLGAEVIKIEIPGAGDDTRHWGPPFIGGESAYFLSVNRNKKSLTLNLTSDAGKNIFYELAAKCDVLLENFRPGVTEKLRIDYSTIAKINPNLVYCSITSFGQTGQYRERLAYDIVVQSMGGLMGITGEPNRPPVRIGVALSDIGAGMYAAIAILGAIIARQRLGGGQWLDVSLLDSTVSWMTYMAADYFATGHNPERMGSAHPSIVPYQCFKTKDKQFITVAIGNDKLFRKFSRAIGMEKLADEPMFATNPDRVRHRDQLIPILEKIFAKKTREEWLKALLDAKLPVGPVYSMQEIFADPHIKNREMLAKIQHPKAGMISQVGIPMRFSRTALDIKSPPPFLGEHTDEILHTLLGYDAHRISELHAKGVV
ncbi:MAG: CaiB/BaiF CoA-transferase family protein [Candidatus Bathyarchaeia archaeon]